MREAVRWNEYRVQNFRLASGEVLPEATTAYATLGELNGTKSNAVLILHGYTTGPSMLLPGSNAAEGSWSGLIGAGKAIDTDRHFVICPNMLGSSYGSTGPRSLNPATGRRYGIDFPRVSLSDVVDLQALLLDSLGIRQLAAVAGPSLGAMQAFTWATRYPERVARVVAAVGAPYRPPWVVSTRDALAALERDPAWRNGHYEPDALQPTLTRMRVATLERYGIDAELAPRFADPTQRRREIERLAAEWAREFDPGSLVTLAQTVENFDVRGDLVRMRAPLLYVLSHSDETFPPILARELAPLYEAARLRWSYLELASDKGHLASGADWQLWAEALEGFMNTPPAIWRPAGFAERWS